MNTAFFLQKDGFSVTPAERDAARGGVHSDGIYRVRRLLYVAKADYGGRPPSGKRLNLDGREYRVVQADDAAGMLTIEIEANRT